MNDGLNEENVDSTTAPLIEHLTELRTRLMKAALFFRNWYYYLLFCGSTYF